MLDTKVKLLGGFYTQNWSNHFSEVDSTRAVGIFHFHLIDKKNQN